ncbi:MAG: site-2 protease family protein [Candidatus Helarchaeota archaeon]|nr:site-2 protease family protein [Candidatus Helarchaeota archaeon]
MVRSQFDVWMFFLFLLSFWLCLWGIGTLFKLEKRGWEIGPGLLLAKTTRLNRFINKVAKRFPRFWRALLTVGIGFGFFAMVFTMVWLGINLHGLLTAPRPEQAIVPFIPGVTVTGLPLLYMIIPIAIIMFSHEVAHGIAARIDGVTVKSSGFLAFIVFFGAFVELDDKQAAKKKRLTRQRIFIAGSFINLIIALFALILVTNMYRVGEGAYLYKIETDGAAYGILQQDEIIMQVNGTQIRDGTHLDTVLDQFKPFDPANFTVQAENGSISNRLVITGFNRTAAYRPWGQFLINNGTYVNGGLENLSTSDQARLLFNSSNTYLNFSLLINFSAFSISAVNLTWIVIDLDINASLSVFNTSKAYIVNITNPSQNYEIFSFQNLSSEVTLTGNISRAAGYKLEDYVNGSEFLQLDFIFNASTDFNVSIDLCKLYPLTNQTEGRFGIWIGNYLLDRELAILFGPLAPHVYQTLVYLYMFSLAVGLINLLPIPPFDGDKLFTSLFNRDFPRSNSSESSGEGSDEKSKTEQLKPKEPWTWVKTFIWSVRGLAIFLLLSNIILSLILFDIFSIFSGILY